MRVAGSIAWLAAATLVALPASAASVEDYERKFAEWMEAFATRFGSAREYAARLETFIANDQFIEAHNARDDVSFTLGHNAFSLMTFAEFAATKKGLRLPPGYLEQRQTANNATDVQRRPVTVDDVPESVDWVAKGGVTPVKNQGQCGSCWAFSTTGAVEGAAFVSSGKLVSLSEQELVDCDHDGDQGCNGGLMDHAFHWIEKHKGICSEEAYAYHAAVGTCHKCKPVVKVSGFEDVNANDEGALKIAVAQQPVSVAIEADEREFQFYKTGVFDLTCGTQLDHGVLVVGYGTEQQNGKKFWKVKNSWGAAWGESGYIRLSREMGQPSGQCGVAMVPSYPKAAVADGTTDAISGIVQDELQRYKEAVEALEEQLLAAEPKALRGPSIMEELAEEQGTSVYQYFGEDGI